MTMSALRWAMRTVRTRVGTTTHLDDWANWARIPHRGRPGAHVDGQMIRDLLGIVSKAWDPETFRDPETTAALGREALELARWRPADLDALVLVTCTPFELTLDQDAHRFGRLLEVPDDVPVLLIHAGCAGLARAVAHLRRSSGSRALILTWNAPGAFMTMPDGSPNALYRDNGGHPDAAQLWFSPALFSDGAAACALERLDHAAGVSIYSRDSASFNGGAGVKDPLVVFPGGGALHPPGHPLATAMSAFGMHGRPIQAYYTAGMIANARELETLVPGYSSRVARIYTHQASPNLIDAFLRSSGLPLEKIPRNCDRLGNLVSVSTLRLLDEDLAASHVTAGDLLCFSVVGAGPERGAFILPYLPPGIS